MNVIKEINRINLKEALMGVKEDASWHFKYGDSAYVFLGGLPFDLTEGDIIVICSQYGEIVDCNLVRDKKTGKSKGYAFVAYEDQRSTTLAVDNFNGTKILGRTIRVDHVAKYKKPKGEKSDSEDEDGEKPKKSKIPESVKKTYLERGGDVAKKTILDPDEIDPMANYKDEDEDGAKSKKRKPKSDKDENKKKIKLTPEEKQRKKLEKKKLRENETPEERAVRKEKKKLKKEEKRKKKLEGKK